MNLVIHGLTECLILDILLLWFFVCVIIFFVLLFLGTLFVENGLLTINDNNIINKIIKLKNEDRYLYKFTKKLDKYNIEYLNRYIKRFEKVVYLTRYCKIEKEFINGNEERLYQKIESIIYYYNLINKN